jgi:Asp-tRNA(Asn)/Glu-tRNA(Gln) amidotransferase A subunit family amidase
VGKAWYNFFVVTDGQGKDGARAAGSAGGSPTEGSQPEGRRAADLVGSPDAGSDAAIDPSFAAAATNLTALGDIYTSAQIAAPAHGYTVLKVAEMLQSEHIRALPPDVKRKSILVALEAAGVSVDEIVQDAVHRDRALDTYERVLQKNLDELRAEKQAENARLEQEIAERLSELRTRIDQNNQGVAGELENLHAWQARKQDEERRIAEAVSYFVSENPITATAATATATGRAADDKGDVNAR